jgi:hypothetical protein
MASRRNKPGRIHERFDLVYPKARLRPFLGRAVPEPATVVDKFLVGARTQLIPGAA